MRIREVKNGYVVVSVKAFNKYGENAFVDRICFDLDEANYVKESLERNDHIEFMIIEKNE